MKETIFEQVASAASVLKLDLSAEGIRTVCRRPGILGSWNGSCAGASLLSQ